MTATLIGLLFLAITYINGHFLMQRLKMSHHNVWVALGMPKLGDSNVSGKWWFFLKFVWSGKFLQLKDSQLTFMCVTAMILELGVFIAFMFMLFA